MTYALLAALLLQPAAFFIYLDRLSTRHAAQVESVLQRIQDPAAAVAAHAMQTVEYPVQHLPFGDDEAYLQYAEELNGRS